MIGQHMGHVRVSPFDRNPNRKLENAQGAWTFIDKAFDKGTKRTQFSASMNFIQPGNALVLHSISIPNLC
jgi:hypothetical protein